MTSGVNGSRMLCRRRRERGTMTGRDMRQQDLFRSLRERCMSPFFSLRDKRGSRSEAYVLQNMETVSHSVLSNRETVFPLPPVGI